MAKLIFKTESLRLYRCTDHGQMLGTFRLPVNALYGHDQEGDFVYVHPHRDYIISRSNFQAIKSRILSLSVLRYKGKSALSHVQRVAGNGSGAKFRSVYGDSALFWFDSECVGSALVDEAAQGGKESECKPEQRESSAQGSSGFSQA